MPYYNRDPKRDPNFDNYPKFKLLTLKAKTLTPQDPLQCASLKVRWTHEFWVSNMGGECLSEYMNINTCLDPEGYIVP